MKERPILFSTAMVRAILEGRKTQTRRVMRRQPDAVEYFKRGEVTADTNAENAILRCYNNPKGFKKCASGWSASATYKTPFSEFNVGDRLWVRETFRFYDSDECPHADFPCGCPRNGTPLFKASHDCGDGEKWKPSIHMPRSACRLILEIANIRVERLIDISESDCLKEGVGSPILRDCKKPKFMQLWESINGADSWSENPWVWVIEFKVIQGGEL
ncbi:hypothetical protein ACPC5U_12885 [Acinetobacter haemolyticus]|uniref:hypothetical protein n=1 Tax=Acinetobacter haemolyticus TaxID=29430 RepID=UPI003C1F0E97